MQSRKHLCKFTCKVDGEVIADKKQYVTMRGMPTVLRNFGRKTFSRSLHEQGKKHEFLCEIISTDWWTGDVITQLIAKATPKIK